MSEMNLDLIDQMYASRESTIARDLKLNLKRLLGESQLSAEEALLTLLATAQSAGATQLVEFSKTQLTAAGVSAEHILEAQESAAIMGMLNVYYRTKHFLHQDEEYKSAGLRMTALARPALGKERFEMLAFAVSCIGACEMCVTSHEKVLRGHGVSVDKIHDLIRMAAVVKGLSAL